MFLFHAFHYEIMALSKHFKPVCLANSYVFGGKQNVKPAITEETSCKRGCDH